MHWGPTQTSLGCSRMVRENVPVSTQKQKQNQSSGAQSQEAGPSSERHDTSPAESSDIQLELHRWSSESESPEHEWRQELCEVDNVVLPSHLHSFSSPEQFILVKQTYQQLQHSGYYWGALSMEEAHAILSDVPLGTFLIRDSVQPDVFFTLSYRSDEAPTSVRVLLNKELLFSLHGSYKTFTSLFALLAHYTGPSCKLTVPHRKERPEQLMRMCRRTIVRIYGMDRIKTIPGLSTENKNYIYLYPHSI